MLPLPGSFRFGDLPRDIFFAILDICAAHRGALYNLSLTSKAIQSSCIPLLYRNVDLSTHNRGRLVEFEDGQVVQECWADANDDYLPDDAKPRQDSFLRTLTAHPEYGAFVRSFAWTLIWTGYPPWVGLRDIEFHTWSVFSSLTNVQDLDLASLHCNRSERYVRQNPPRLFSSAVRIRLLGWMHYGLVTSILHSVDPSKLQHLALDNLQDEGQYADGSPMSLDDGDYLLGKIETINPDGSRGFMFPGPMRRVLEPLEGRCTALKSLLLRKAGQESIQLESCNFTGMGGWSPEADDAVYGEWATFLSSVIPTLEILVFEQAVAPKTGRRSGRDGYQTVRPMDERFRRLLLPNLLAGSWPRLQRMEIRGVGRWLGVPALDEGTKAQIRDAVGSHVLLVLEEEPSRPCQKFVGYG